MNNKRKSKIILGLLIAIVTLGIGYAAIAGINLLINGTSSVKSSDGNFAVRFVRNDANETAIENPQENAIKISGKNADDSNMDVSGVSASITDDTTAAFSLGELDEVGEYVEITYMVVNESEGIDAMLSCDVADENDAEKYFEMTKTIEKSILEEGETSTVKVKVKLIDRPIVSDFDATFKLTLTATPVENEDLSGHVSGTTAHVASTDTLAKALQSNGINTIELDNDITVSKNTNLKIDEDTTINFNGNTLTVAPGSLKVTDGAELTLSDEDGNGGIQSAYNAITVEEDSEVIIESGTYATTEFTGRGSVITIPKDADNATITINGGTINAKYFAVSSFGDGEVTLNGGEFNSTASVKQTDDNGTQYYAYTVRVSKGHLTINDGAVINGTHGAIGIIQTATATINGGTVTLNNSYSGANDSFYCLYVEGQAAAEVLGGTFTNNGSNPLVYSSSTGLVNLKGGTWTGKNAKAFNGTPNAGKDSIKVYSGTYKKNTSGTLTDYDVSAYAA